MDVNPGFSDPQREMQCSLGTEEKAKAGGLTS